MSSQRVVLGEGDASSEGVMSDDEVASSEELCQARKLVCTIFQANQQI